LAGSPPAPRAFVSIGLAIAFNETSGDTAAYVNNTDQGVTTTGGRSHFGPIEGSMCSISHRTVFC